MFVLNKLLQFKATKYNHILVFLLKTKASLTLLVLQTKFQKRKQFDRKKNNIRTVTSHTENLAPFHDLNLTLFKKAFRSENNARM